MTGDPPGSTDRDDFEASGLDACFDKTSEAVAEIEEVLRRHLGLFDSPPADAKPTATSSQEACAASPSDEPQCAGPPAGESETELPGSSDSSSRGTRSAGVSESHSLSRWAV